MHICRIDDKKSLLWSWCSEQCLSISKYQLTHIKPLTASMSACIYSKNDSSLEKVKLLLKNHSIR